MLERLRTLDVTHIAEEDHELKMQFSEVTSLKDCTIDGWITSKPVAILGKNHLAPRVIEPQENITAVVVNLNRGPGAVKIVNGEQDVGIYQTGSTGQQGAVMAFLSPGFHCIVMGNAIAKYIKSTS